MPPAAKQQQQQAHATSDCSNQFLPAIYRLLNLPPVHQGRCQYPAWPWWMPEIRHTVESLRKTTTAHINRRLRANKLFCHYIILLYNARLAIDHSNATPWSPLSDAQALIRGTIRHTHAAEQPSYFCSGCTNAWVCCFGSHRSLQPIGS
jgi:hypothetical protein